MALRESKYPGPECLEPYELELYVKDALHEDRVSHTRECVPCAALLKSAAPSTAGLNKLLAEIREEVEKSSVPVDTTHEPPKWIFMDALATAVPVGVSVWAALFFYWYRLPSNTSEQIVNSVSWVVIQPALLGLVALLVVFAALTVLVKASNFFASHRLLASSGGAFAVSVTLGCFLFYGTYRSLVSNTSKSELEITLLQTQLAQAIAAAGNKQTNNREFTSINFVSGLVDVQTVSTTPNKITYQATVRDLPGKLVAEVTDDTGEFYWQSSKRKPEKTKNEEVAKLLFGTVKSVDSKNISLVDRSGLSHNLKLSRELSPTPARGEKVLAVFEATSLKVQSVHSIPNSR